MNWSVSPKRSTATSDLGYRITWATHPERKQLWFNAYSPQDRCIEAGFDKDACKQACERHAAKHQEISPQAASGSPLGVE